MLFLDADGEPLTVLPTHRVVRGLGDDGRRAAARAGSTTLFDGRARRRPPTSSSRRFEAAGGLAAAARVGSGSGRATAGALLTARRDAFEPLLPDGGDAVRALDVTLLGVALERLAGIDADGRRGRRRIALHEVGRRGDRPRSTPARDGADAAFLLEPTPVASILGGRRATAT